MEIGINSDQKIRIVKADPATASEKSTKISGNPIWTVVSGAVQVVDISPDGLSATLVPSDTDFSDSVIEVSGNADLSGGTKIITTQILFKTTQASNEATHFNFTLETPTLK